MNKGILFNKVSKKIEFIFENVRSINTDSNTVIFNDSKNGTGKLNGFDNEYFDLVVTDDARELKVGDTLPADIMDKKAELIKQSSEELVNSLGMEITKLKFEIMTLKGGAAL